MGSDKKKRMSEASAADQSSKKSRKSSGKAAEGETKDAGSTSLSKGKAKEAPLMGSSLKLHMAGGGNPYGVGAVLVSAADFAPPRDIRYTLHQQPGASSSSSQQGSNGAPTLEDGMLLSGESGTMDFVATNWDLNAGVAKDNVVRRDAKGYSGEYLVGVYDPEKGTVTFRAAPMFTLRRSIKSLNSLSIDAANDLVDWQARIAARRGLGEAFGNRKTKAKARAEDRMKVDTSNMLDVMDTLQDEIEETKPDMLSMDQINAEAQQARPIPPPNLAALTPHEAYPLDVLIPDSIFRLLSTKILEEAESQDQLGRILPVRASQSTWLKVRMWSMIQSAQLRRHNAKANGKASSKISFDDDVRGGEDDGAKKTSRQDARTKLKVALYIAYMWAFLAVVGQSRDSGGEMSALLGKLRLDKLPGGEQVLSDLFARFSEVQRGKKRGTVTNFTETKLHAYMFALCLHLDDFRTDPTPLARDLSMSPIKVTEVFRSLGCTPNTTKTVAGADGSSRQRVMVLKCPIELPTARKRARK